MNRFPLRSPRFSTSTSLLLCALVGATVWPAQAQRPIPGGALTALPRLPIAVAPELRSYLVQTKARVAPQVLESQVVLRGNIPFARLQDGREQPLIPLSLMESGAKRTSAEQIPAEFADLAPYIKSAKITGGSQISSFKFKPGLLFGLNTDLRPKMTPVKDQSGRGTCVAFAANAALEIFPSIPDDLSEQYSNDLFMRKENRTACEDGIRTIDSAPYLADGTVAESLWNYTNTPPACDIVVPAAAKTATKYKITDYQLIEDNGPSGASIKNPAYLESILRSGKPIVFGTFVAWNSGQSKGVMDVVINSATNQPFEPWAGHAMLLVGYNASQNYFILKNSWGTGFGHSGYMYLSYDYVRTYAKYGYYIEGVSPKATLMTIPNLTMQIDPSLTLPRRNPALRLPGANR